MRSQLLKSRCFLIEPLRVDELSYANVKEVVFYFCEFSASLISSTIYFRPKGLFQLALLVSWSCETENAEIITKHLRCGKLVFIPCLQLFHVVCSPYICEHRCNRLTIRSHDHTCGFFLREFFFYIC